MSAFYAVSAPPSPLSWGSPENTTCWGEAGGCRLLELGPPPAGILRLPPPPPPAFLAAAVAGNGSAPAGRAGCLTVQPVCAAAAVDFIEIPRHAATLDDTWFLVIMCACIALTLAAALVAVLCLRLREQHKSRLSADPCSGDKSGPLAGMLYPAGALTSASTGSRALWAGLGTSGSHNHYTVRHVQPLRQLTTPPPPAPSDSCGYATLSPRACVLPPPSADDYGVQVNRLAPDGCVVTTRHELSSLGGHHRSDVSLAGKSRQELSVGGTPHHDISLGESSRHDLSLGGSSRHDLISFGTPGDVDTFSPSQTMDDEHWYAEPGRPSSQFSMSPSPPAHIYEQPRLPCLSPASRHRDQRAPGGDRRHLQLIWTPQHRQQLRYPSPVV